MRDGEEEEETLQMACRDSKQVFFIIFISTPTGLTLSLLFFLV